MDKNKKLWAKSWAFPDLVQFPIWYSSWFGPVSDLEQILKLAQIRKCTKSGIVPNQEKIPNKKIETKKILSTISSFYSSPIDPNKRGSAEHGSTELVWAELVWTELVCAELGWAGQSLSDWNWFWHSLSEVQTLNQSCKFAELSELS